METPIHLGGRVLERIASAPPRTVWTPADFLDLGGREAVDKTLQRLVKTQALRRIDRGLYDQPTFNRLTHALNPADPRGVIDAVARRDQARLLIDGMTAANDLGLTTAVPAQVTVLTDARLRPITLGAQQIHFRQAAPSRLHWAGRPAMRVVQALHWLRDVLPSDRDAIQRRLSLVIARHDQADAIVADLRAGLSAMPIWMHALVRDLIAGLSHVHDRHDDQQGHFDGQVDPVRDVRPVAADR
jgi:hypothetical protein